MISQSDYAHRNRTCVSLGRYALIVSLRKGSLTRLRLAPVTNTARSLQSPAWAEETGSNDTYRVMVPSGASSSSNVMLGPAGVPSSVAARSIEKSSDVALEIVGDFTKK